MRNSVEQRLIVAKSHDCLGTFRLEPGIRNSLLRHDDGHWRRHAHAVSNSIERVEDISAANRLCGQQASNMHLASLRDHSFLPPVLLIVGGCRRHRALSHWSGASARARNGEVAFTSANGYRLPKPAHASSAGYHPAPHAPSAGVSWRVSRRALPALAYSFSSAAATPQTQTTQRRLSGDRRVSPNALRSPSIQTLNTRRGNEEACSGPTAGCGTSGWGGAA